MQSKTIEPLAGKTQLDCIMTDKPNVRVRAIVAIVADDKILLTPHYQSDGTTVWNLPGGAVRYGETLREAAERELLEETGYTGKAKDLLHVYEVIEPKESYHGIGVAFSGIIVGGELRAEEHRIYGTKLARWFTKGEVSEISCNRPEIISIAFGTK